MTTIYQRGKSTTVVILGLILLLSFCAVGKLSGQSLSLTEAYDLLESNYPNLRNAGLNDQILSTELDLLDLERKPTLNLLGSATLQSETTGFENAENLPLEIDIPLYSARAYGEASYTIYDGGRLDARKRVTEAEGKLANQQLEVERFGLRKRINQLFLGILLSREQVSLFATTLADIAERKATVAQAVELGAALESEVLQLSVRQVEIEAQRDNATGTIARLVAQLSTLTGRELSSDVDLQLPDLPGATTVPMVQRPELDLFQLQQAAIGANEALIEADTKPLVSTFLQAGVGAPNPLNLFDNGIAPYALGGVNFKWKLKDWGKSDKLRQLLQLRTAQLDNQRETFLFNLNSVNDAYLADVERLSQQIERNRKIAQLQAEILTQMAAQLDNGVITATDYLSQANTELLARQKLRIDRTQLTEIQLNFLNERGDF
ncbi:TolC family protein [Lewinella sp. 4G2]|uniref:TolC family protein n=1 Tax=Lewinella sp. 4G2 TaxID=1803372 RepID=UPI0007B4637C|nr:TolC family protein [Lewinella sp. 4G2]OAV44048.1 hypothetical protein A3850_005855 [Lewinella sp. 4G2]